MASKIYFAGLDIGSHTIKILLVSKNKKDDQTGWQVVSCLETPTFGVRRGVVIDIEKVSEIIQSLISKLQTDTGKKIDSVFVNINGSHLTCVSSRGMVAVSRADRYISQEDIKRVLQEATRAVALPSNTDVLDVISQKFIVDGIAGIKFPDGLQGGRLETEVLLLSHFVPYKNNLIQAVLNADLHILDIIPSTLASATVVLNSKQKELGVALIEIGAGTTGLAVFKENELIHYAVLPIGSANITADIAVGLKTDIDIAENIKIELGQCNYKGKDKKEKIEISGDEFLIFSQKNLTRIIEARLAEILNEVQKELKLITKNTLLPAGVVFVGGGAQMSGLVEFAKKQLKLPCRLGRNIYFPELSQNLNYATVSGLIIRGLEINKKENLSLWEEGLGAKIKRIFKFFLS